MTNCVTCGLPLTTVVNPEGGTYLCHDATLREVLGRALSLGVPSRHNVRQHATPPVTAAPAAKEVSCG